MRRRWRVLLALVAGVATGMEKVPVRTWRRATLRQWCCPWLLAIAHFGNELAAPASTHGYFKMARCCKAARSRVDPTACVRGACRKRCHAVIGVFVVSDQQLNITRWWPFSSFSSQIKHLNLYNTSTRHHLARSVLRLFEHSLYGDRCRAS